MNSNPANPDLARRAHEPDSPSSLRNVFIAAASVIIMVAVCLAAAAALLHFYSRSRPLHPMAPLGILTAPDSTPLTHLPAPSLELDDGHADFTILKSRAEEKLNSYGWVDRANGVVRMPIGRAMDLLVLRGVPEATNGAVSARERTRD